ncbi:NF-kappa-B essential modulator [Aplysia californica]|uniref:NF-kappa-B essential modulator n=1 Tax=Aplysia californica TaxID=6500 RepID=A0ABM0ZUB1_APLCA|nr:NF-kappa-B essential modulator [Aplysia californica]
MMASVDARTAAVAGLGERPVVVQQETGLPQEVTEATLSLTDMTLEQARARLQEMQSYNMSLRDNLREHNKVMKEQFEALSDWRKRETGKFEQTKALITALRAENQELQLKVMTLEDKTKDLSSQVQSLEKEKGHLLRQKAFSDQRAINIEKQAEEQGIVGLEASGGDDVSDAVVFVATADKEQMILDLECSVAQKNERIATLRAELLKKEEEVGKFRDSTKQLLKDMESQQKLKEAVEGENRTLQSQILQAEHKLHQHMQSVIQTTKREIQVDQMFGPVSTEMQPALGRGEGGAAGGQDVSENWKDLGQLTFRQGSSEVLDTVEKMAAKMEEERRSKAQVVLQVEQLQAQLKELSVKNNNTEQQLQEARQEVQATAARLGAEYETKLMEVARQSSVQGTRSIQASNTEDLSIMRSQVLTLIKEVDEKQNNLSAAMAAISTKDGRIRELEESNHNLQKDYRTHWQETHSLIQNLRLQLGEQHRAQQENSLIKRQHHQLQMSFNEIVSEYRELVDMVEANKADMHGQSPHNSKELMEELNRLTAQVMAADEAIALRDEQITRLKRAHNTTTNHEEEIQLLKMQAELYKNDFDAERESRTRLAEERDKLAEEMKALHERHRQLELEMDQRQISDIQRRVWAGGQARMATPPTVPHPDYPGRLRTTPPLAQDFRQAGAGGGFYTGMGRMNTPPPNPAPPQGEEEEPQSLRRYDCPACNAVFPDQDSLQLHVGDCLERQ